MSTLAGQRQRDTYQYLLQVPGDVVAGLVQAQTGDGKALAVALSEDGVKILGVLDLSAATIAGLSAAALTSGAVDPARLPKHTHAQSVPAAVWTVTHNLNFRPAVTVVDSADTVVYGQVEYLSDDAVRLTFSAPFGGSAYFN